MDLLAQAEFLRRHQVHLFFKLGEIYCDPLLPEEFKKIKDAGILKDHRLRQVIERTIPDHLSQLEPGMYFPQPIVRELSPDLTFDPQVFQKFFFPFLKIDSAQNWFWRGSLLSGKIQSFFQKNLIYLPQIQRYAVEYWVVDHFDKCYLDCAITPISAIRLLAQEGCSVQILLNNQQSDFLDPNTFRLDSKERLFCQSQNFGEVLFGETPRFLLLQKLNETGDAILLGGQCFTLKV